MSTLARRGEPSLHDISVDYTTREVQGAPHGLILATSIHPQLWHPGDLVAATATDGGHFEGRVVLVERAFNTAVVQIPGQRTSPEP